MFGQQTGQLGALLRGVLNSYNNLFCLLSTYLTCFYKISIPVKYLLISLPVCHPP